MTFIYLHSNRLLLIVFLTIAFFQSAMAQETHYKPDSIITYTFIGNDTLHKKPVSKTSFKYNPQFQLIEKNNYDWDNKKTTWINTQRSKYKMMSNDVYEEKYNMMNDSNKFEVKTMYKFKKPFQLTECTNEKIQNNEIIILGKEIYEYVNDTLSKVEQYKRSTTFYKSSVREYLQSTNTLIEKMTNYTEVGQNVILKTINKKDYNGTMLKTFTTSYEPATQRPTLITYKYNKDNKLLSDTLKLAKTTKEKEIYQKLSIYLYDNAFHLKAHINYNLTEKGKIDVKKENTMSIYYCKPSSPIYLKKHSDFVIE